MQALLNFTRFPTSMRRNTVVRDVVGWLRERNRTQAHANRAAFYGMDLYSAVQPRQEVLRLLETAAPGQLGAVRKRHVCLSRLGTGLNSGCPVAARREGSSVLSATVPGPSGTSLPLRFGDFTPVLHRFPRSLGSGWPAIS